MSCRLSEWCRQWCRRYTGRLGRLHRLRVRSHCRRRRCTGARGRNLRRGFRVPTCLYPSCIWRRWCRGIVNQYGSCAGWYRCRRRDTVSRGGIGSRHVGALVKRSGLGHGGNGFGSSSGSGSSVDHLRVWFRISGRRCRYAIRVRHHSRRRSFRRCPGRSLDSGLGQPGIKRDLREHRLKGMIPRAGDAFRQLTASLQSPMAVTTRSDLWQVGTTGPSREFSRPCPLVRRIDPAAYECRPRLLVLPSVKFKSPVAYCLMWQTNISSSRLSRSEVAGRV